MSTRRYWCLGVLAALGGALVMGRPLVADEAAAPRELAAALIERVLRDDNDAVDPAQRIAQLDMAAKQVGEALPANVMVAAQLAGTRESIAAAQGDADPGRAVAAWRKSLAEARETLVFEPLIEAPLPEGFPDPVPVGEVRLQQVPAYRLARTPMGFLEGRAFWTLFNHIKERDIAMTAPVEMTYTQSEGGGAKATAMSFLYRSTSQGQTGKAGSVDVVDVEAHWALSMGLRGEPNRKRVEEAQAFLDRWLAEHAAEYEPSGPLRVMGYNSPFVPDNRKYTEVQIPLRAKSVDASGG